MAKTRLHLSLICLTLRQRANWFSHASLQIRYGNSKCRSATSCATTKAQRTNKRVPDTQHLDSTLPTMNTSDTYCYLASATDRPVAYDLKLIDSRQAFGQGQAIRAPQVTPSKSADSLTACSWRHGKTHIWHRPGTRPLSITKVPKHVQRADRDCIHPCTCRPPPALHAMEATAASALAFAAASRRPKLVTRL
jgi:hypothetical protein